MMSISLLGVTGERVVQKARCGLERRDPTADAKAGPDDGCGELKTNRIGFYGGDSSRGFSISEQCK